MDHFDPQVIVIFLAMIGAGIKALIERYQARKNPPLAEEDDFSWEDYETREKARAQQNHSPIHDLYQETKKSFQEGLEASRKAPAPRPQIPASIPPIQADLNRAPKPKSGPKPGLKPSTVQLPAHSPSKTSAKGSTRSRLYAHLHSPTAAREALVLAEVLGPPKSLQKSPRTNAD